MEGPYYGLPAFAVSMKDMTEERCVETARLVWQLIQKITLQGRFPGIVNVNVPPQGEISLKKRSDYVPDRSDLSQRHCRKARPRRQYLLSNRR